MSKRINTNIRSEKYYITIQYKYTATQFSFDANAVTLCTLQTIPMLKKILGGGNYLQNKVPLTKRSWLSLKIKCGQGWSMNENVKQFSSMSTVAVKYVYVASKVTNAK